MINIVKYLNQGLTRKTRTSYDKYGKSNTTSSNFDGRLVAATIQNRGLQAKPLDYDVEVWMLPDQAMLIDDIIYDGTVNYRVIQVNEYRAKNGDIHHKKALCQKYV